jgi:hypothetical protein
MVFIKVQSGDAGGGGHASRISVSVMRSAGFCDFLNRAESTRDSVVAVLSDENPGFAAQHIGAGPHGDFSDSVGICVGFPSYHIAVGKLAGLNDHGIAGAAARGFFFGVS